MKFMTCVFALLLFFACSQTQVDQTAIEQAPILEVDEFSFDYPVKKEVLPNGLTVIMVQNKLLPIFSYYTFFQVGGKHERDGITGSTHFLEHMMFKGAKKYGAGRFDKIIEGNGGSSNAYTTNDMTVYYESLPSDKLELIVDVESDRLANLLLEKESFEKERQVVLEERKLRYENSPRGKLYLNMMRYMFEGTPYGTSVIGKIKDLKSVSREQMMEYFKTFYAPNNAVVVVVGDIDFYSTLKTIKQYYADIPASEEIEKTKKKLEDAGRYKFKGHYGRTVWLHGSAPLPMFILSYKGLPVGTREAYVLDILSGVLADGKSSYLQQEFVHTNRPLLTQVYAANYTLQHSGVFFVGGELIKGVGINTLKKRLKRAVKKACTKASSVRNVQKIKNQYLVDFYSGLETNAGVASLLGNSYTYYDNHMHFIKELEIYKSITSEEVRRACLKFLRDDQSIFLNIWNKNKK